jgi:hypothetical protein
MQGHYRQPTFTISETTLTGTDADDLRYWVRHGEILASNPTGMQFLIPREEVLKLMPTKTDDSAAQMEAP